MAKAVVDSKGSHSRDRHIERSLDFRSRIARIPRSARYLLVVLSSFVLSSSLLTVFSSQTAGHLAGVSKHLEEWWEVGGLVLWRATELGLTWIVGFDGEHNLSLSLSFSSFHASFHSKPLLKRPNC